MATTPTRLQWLFGQAYPVIESYDWVRDAQGHVIVDPVSGLPSKSSTLSILGQATPKDILGITSSLTFKKGSPSMPRSIIAAGIKSSMRSVKTSTSQAMV